MSSLLSTSKPKKAMATTSEADLRAMNPRKLYHDILDGLAKVSTVKCRKTRRQMQSLWLACIVDFDLIPVMLNEAEKGGAL